MASIGSPFGYASLRYIDYPTQILGKSCKLVPVMLMNIILYRRKFALHKYLVVGTVTAGISLFMLCAPVSASKSSKGASSNSLFGVGLLLVNLLIDGAINSTQDEVFVRYKMSGTQMMFFMNAFATLITLITMLVPLPNIPLLNSIFSPSSSSKGSNTGHSELAHALAFIQSHPKVLRDILLFSAAGATGQLFIFDTLENFGSLTLVTITVTRKLFTMLLSLVVFNHHLAFGQWIGVFTVFAGIAIEAQVKRKETIAKKKLKEKKLDGDGLAQALENKEGKRLSSKKNGLAPFGAKKSGNGELSGTVTPVRMKDI
jgi:UDP-galactose transporter B1